MDNPLVNNKIPEKAKFFFADVTLVKFSLRFAVNTPKVIPDAFRPEEDFVAKLAWI